MNELTPAIFISLWQAAKAQQTPDDEDLARMQKYMMMHEDMHPYFEQFEQDPSMSMEVEGENLMLHIAMDAATEKSLELGEPAGVREMMQNMLNAGVEPGQAFHVISQAMMHSFILAAEKGEAMDPADYLMRVQMYAGKVMGE